MGMHVDACMWVLVQTGACEWQRSLYAHTSALLGTACAGACDFVTQHVREHANFALPYTLLVVLSVRYPVYYARSARVVLA